LQPEVRVYAVLAGPVRLRLFHARAAVLLEYTTQTT
jgi:hypothetical protein